MKSKWIFFAALWIASLAAAFIIGQGSNTPVSGDTSDSANSLSANTKQDRAALAKDDGFADADGLAEDVQEEQRSAGKAASAFSLLANGELSRENWMKATLEAMTYNSEQLETALGQVMEMPASRQRDQIIYEMLARWGALDPQKALAFAENIQSLEMRNRGMGEVLEGWAMADPASALNWLDTNGMQLSARVYGDYLEDIIEGYAQNNAASAFQYVMNLPEDISSDRRIKQGALREVIDAMVEQNQISQALDLTLTMEESDMRNRALSEIVDEWAERDPLAAKAFIESMPDDPAYADMQRSLLSEWAEDDPVAAAEWLSSLDPETSDQARLATSLVANWTRYDMEAAANWLNSLPASPELDRAVGIYSMRAAQDDPEIALGWAKSVNDDRQRERLESRILPLLREQDTEAFEAYLTDSSYSDEQKQQLRDAEIRDGYRRWGRW